ncbi:MAG: hypothetical protein E7355_00920 [Clostridiales bacterium]|nr:hypothetical protein [Clostridiales bacterium]
MLQKYVCFIYSWVLLEDKRLLIVLLSSIALMIIGCVLSCLLKSGTVSVSFALIIAGGVLSFLAYTNNIAIDSIPFISLLIVTFGCLQSVFYFAWRLAQRIKRKRLRKENQARQMQYTLPQKDNTFIRARLHTAINDEPQLAEQENGEEITLRFTYARRLLAKLRGENLSVTERAEVDELSNIFALFIKRDTFINEDVRLISEAFSRVLKLAAKYGV